MIESRLFPGNTQLKKDSAFLCFLQNLLSKALILNCFSSIIFWASLWCLYRVLPVSKLNNSYEGYMCFLCSGSIIFSHAVISS